MLEMIGRIRSGDPDRNGMLTNITSGENKMAHLFDMTLRGNTPSKKSSQVMIPKLRRLVPNARYQKWEKDNLKCFKIVSNNEPIFPTPSMVHCLMTFYRDSHRRFDYVNLIQSVQDFLVKARIIGDDCADLFVPIVAGYEYDKDNPRCELSFYDGHDDTVTIRDVIEGKA